MSTKQYAQRTATRAADSTVLEYLTRAGFVGYGVVHLLFAWLALQVAFGRQAEDSDQSGALQALARQPAGRTLVVLIIIGMVAMAIWQGFEAAVGHRAERGKQRIAERAVSAVRTLLYLYLAYSGYKVLQGVGSSNSDNQQRTTEHLMTSAGGRWLVGLAGLVVAGVGVGLVVYGYRRSFLKHLNTTRMSTHVRTLTRRLGVAGYAAKGVAYAVAGVLLLVAAVNYDPDKARGLDGALHALAEQSYGVALLGLVAAGIAAYGLYCFLQARYRKV